MISKSCFEVWTSNIAALSIRQSICKRIQLKPESYEAVLVSI